MQQADDVSSYAREECPRIHCVRSLMIYSSYRKKCPRPFFVDDRHGNIEIHMRTKFHLHALYGEQVWEVKKKLYSKEEKEEDEQNSLS